MNKKKLYESIMKNISESVMRVINDPNNQLDYDEVHSSRINLFLGVDLISVEKNKKIPGLYKVYVEKNNFEINDPAIALAVLSKLVKNYDYKPLGIILEMIDDQENTTLFDRFEVDSFFYFDKLGEEDLDMADFIHEAQAEYARKVLDYDEYIYLVNPSSVYHKPLQTLFFTK